MSTLSTIPPVAFDPGTVRNDFPILFRPVRNGRRLVYLDNAATTQKPAAVIDGVRDYYTQMNASVHRSIHRLAELSTERYEEARRRVARFIGAPSERAIVFTRGTTEGINLVARAWGDRFVKAGDEIVLTELEHHSNLVPWQMLAGRTGARLRFARVLENGEIDLDSYYALLSPRVRLVACAHVSNVLGTVLPVRAMAAAAHEAGALVLVDGAQSVPHMPVRVGDLGCDFLAFSGHKMCGPTGIGVLYAAEAVQEAMNPFMGGGEMIARVTLESSTWAEIPRKFEAGTPDVSGAIGLAIAMDYLDSLGMEAIHAHEAELTRYTLSCLSGLKGLRVYGQAAERGGAISFSMEGVHPHDVAHLVDTDGVAIRAGHMCAQPLMRKFDVPALSRASLYFYNTRADIDQLVESLGRVRGVFTRGQ